ncbi:MAG: redoxin domain-containing protein [Acidimicrobiia bacterium]|nr:redoxin domain-containing protein [Acidimicrobiia bacterium]
MTSPARDDAADTTASRPRRTRRALRHGDGEPAPTFRLPDLRDPARDIALADFAGRPVVLNFWAAWCGPCRREMPAFERLHHQLGDRVAFVGINHQDGRSDALALLAETGVTYPSAHDPAGEVAQAYGLYRHAHHRVHLHHR